MNFTNHNAAIEKNNCREGEWNHERCVMRSVIRERKRVKPNTPEKQPDGTARCEQEHHTESEAPYVGVFHSRAAIV